MTVKRVGNLSYKKASSYPDTALKGFWEFYYKIDGIRTIGSIDGQYVSRSGKPLRGLNKNATPEARAKLDEFGDCEIFSKDWNTSNSLCMNGESDTPIEADMVYPLHNGETDPRLYIVAVVHPTRDYIHALLEFALDRGYEGIVMRGFHGKGFKWYRFKPEETVDVRVIDIIRGKGKRSDSIGKFVTEHGDVGIFKGITEEDMREIWNQRDQYLGKIIEVSFMEWTVNKKMRHAKFIRPRFDKTEESI